MIIRPLFKTAHFLRSANTTCSSFNGATASPPWKPDERLDRPEQEPRPFNGATASPPWKHAEAWERRRQVEQPSMEPRRRRRGNGSGPPTRCTRYILPSMEPRRRRRGNLLVVVDEPYCPDAFNGATASPPWKRVFGREAFGRFAQRANRPPLQRVETGVRSGGVRTGRAPSMEPRRRRRGNRAEERAKLEAEQNLQWSHGVAAVETPSPH